MNLKLGLIMFMCLAPFLVIMYFVLYPKNWIKKKYIFGVKNREEFKMGEAEAKVEEIVQRNRKMSLWVIIVEIIIGALLLLIPDLTVMMITYTVYILLAFVICNFPYVKGNSELKSLKREFGIQSKGIRVADLKSISSSHALDMPMLLLPNILAGVCMILALLYDFDVLNISPNSLQGSFAATLMAGSFLIMGILFVFIARMMDNMRNEVISEESEVNANYNRAKKKIWSDLWIQMSWLNTAMIIIFMIIILIEWSEAGVIISSIIYMVGIFVILAILASKTAMLNECYKFENEYSDDDDNWIYGMFYYNTRDGRVNVERRDGMGATINLAHPVGKIITVLVALTLIGTIASLVWVGAMDATAIDVRVENGYIICHHLRDEYVIPKDEIVEISTGNGIEQLHPVRIAGVGTEKLLKGRWSVGEDKKVKMFMNPEVDEYIRIKTENDVYYINDNTLEETREIYKKCAEK